jgi:hypothetical protein
MSKERELIKDMKILLECTDMGGLQRNADVLIGRAIELLAQPEPEQEVYAKGYAEAMRQQVYEAYESGRKSAFTNPLSDEVISKFADAEYMVCNNAFTMGVRWAEEQHNITGVDDE